MAFKDGIPGWSKGASNLRVVKSGAEFQFHGEPTTDPDPAFACPPDRAVAIGPQSSAEIILQTSTNLVKWEATTNGVSSLEESPKFFRIMADRAP